MSTLLVDIGNTRVKWARLEGGRLTRQRAAAHAGWTAVDFERKVLATAPRAGRILVASVGGERLERQFATAARRVAKVEPEFVATSRRAGGVTTRYLEPWRLGVDRFVAAIGAHRLAGRRPVCVIDVGTATTIDLVDERGVHVGGAIVPGPELMVSSLLDGTSGIRRRARGAARARGLFARHTRAAVEQGARHAAAAAVDRAVQEARRTLGRTPVVLLTGGAAGSIRALIRCPHRSVPDLVLRGLAVLAEAPPPRRR